MPTTDMDSFRPAISYRIRFAFGAVMLGALLTISSTDLLAQNRTETLQNPTLFTSVPRNLLIRIIRAEDERRWDNDLRELFSARSEVVRSRAALAAGRIGNEASVPDLTLLLRQDSEMNVRAMAAFALGEIESPLAADALLALLKDSDQPPVRARAIEALGKIASALPKEEEARSREWSGVILEAVKLEGNRRSAPDELTILLGLTAVLRAKPENADPVVGQFAHYNDPRVRADVGNTLARLKLKNENPYFRKMLQTDPDPIVRANAARVLGATEDKASFDALVERAVTDGDSRVRVSAIRALGLLKDARAARSLMNRYVQPAEAKSPRIRQQNAWRPGVDELLEVATALGRLCQDANDPRALAWLRQLRVIAGPAPEIEIALIRIAPAAYLLELGQGPIELGPGKQNIQETMLVDWRRASGLALGLGEIAMTPESPQNKQLRTQAEGLLRAMLDYRNSGLTINTLVAVHSEYAVPDVLRSFAAFKPDDLPEVLRRNLKESDVIIRATAAELLGELPLNASNVEALRDALKVALQDRDNDAALAIIDALGKLKNRNANLAIMPALNSKDHLIRRKAVASLKAAGAGDFSSRIGIVKTRNTTADYERAISRIGKTVEATLKTSRGTFTIDLLPEDAPLTVDNFVQLAKRGYFNGISFHRVVPNFVIQGGDPRGDGNGGPGYSIRCEINQVPFERGAVGMALSGKDTGGSQWFVTHAPQPHLDGGYTVFGRVVAGMDVVDKIVRGDSIRSISIRETSRRVPGRR
jgi:cyclophilin family peptidyl-prolyl cis-trans isomerase/HEAT repeat protein